MPSIQRQRILLLPLPRNPAINISFKDVRVEVPVPNSKKEKKSVLKSISGNFKSGELSAIMGPSGAGKSTLLNILTGFQVQGMSGEIQMDGVAVSPGKSSTRSLSCYIMQEDHLNPLFTTQEIMMVAANLKVGSSLSPKAKKLLVEDILDSLGMGTTLYTKCGQLSGGQKKRLCIALELIDNPPIMYLDEPTTGLDSSSATQLVRLLRNLANGGRNIVCTIHQPSAYIFELFDHVYMIASGQCVYQGSPLNLVPFLQTMGIPCPQYHNPADFMLDVVSGEFGQFNDQLVIAAKDPSWRAPEPKQDAVVPKPKESVGGNTQKACVIIQAPSEFSRFFVLFKKNLVYLHRDWTFVYLKAFLHLLVGIVVGLIFQNVGHDGDKAHTNITYFLCVAVYHSFTSLMPAVLKFPSEINILKKEQFNNWYKLRTYYIAFIFTNIPVQMAFSFIFVTTSYYLTNQLFEVTRFIKFSLICQLTIVISECTGLSIGTAENPVNGIFWGSIIMALQIVLGGVLAVLSHMPLPLYYVSFLNYIRYSTQALAITMYGGDREILPCPKEEFYCHFRYPEKILDEMGMTDVSYWGDVSILSIFSVIFICNAYYFLHKKVKSRV
ncbi:unnamed protein product [Nezara viridula]|uniref:ABC transporter domain-containing protein n=1 Tax=Nezara viridula TaxID=85310 RepID=A0A9P0HTI9_NEZVI|nr:unnamed protein product [Nezara viridula]